MHKFWPVKVECVRESACFEPFCIYLARRIWSGHRLENKKFTPTVFITLFYPLARSLESGHWCTLEQTYQYWWVAERKYPHPHPFSSPLLKNVVYGRWLLVCLSALLRLSALTQHALALTGCLWCYLRVSWVQLRHIVVILLWLYIECTYVMI